MAGIASAPGESMHKTILTGVVLGAVLSTLACLALSI